MQPGAAASVLFVDLDGLKQLNDTLGHDRADEMIREVAGRLAGAVRGSDFVGRFGGDEFLILLADTKFEFGADPEGRIILRTR